MTFVPPKSVQILVMPNHPQTYDRNDKVWYWLLSDYELLHTPFARERADIPGQPQTVNLDCTEQGLVPASSDYIRLTKELNPGMTDAVMESMMDSWTPAGAKWREGDKKVPCEIIFASNPISISALMQNPGGLTGVPSTAMVYKLDMLDYNKLADYTAIALPDKDKLVVPDRYIMHLTLNKNGLNIVNPHSAMGGRNGLPVKLLMTTKVPMYIRREFVLCVSSKAHVRNRYSPIWDKGTF